MDSQNEQNGLTAGENTEAAEEPKHIYKLRYKLIRNGQILEEGGARSQIQDDRLLLLPEKSARFDIVYRDILKAEAKDYSLFLQLKGGEEAAVYFLGNAYDSFSSHFFAGYNKIARKDSFMAEQADCMKKGAKFTRIKDGTTEQGTCDIYYGKTAVILQRQPRDPVRIPYALIEDTRYTDYSIQYILENETWEVNMLAGRYDACKKAFADNVAALMQQTADTIKQLKKDITPVALREASRLFLDGRAVAKEDADAVYKGLWTAVFKKSKDYGAAEYFEYLLEKASLVRLGFKKALREEDDYLWMLTVFCGIIVMEAASPAETGRATYLFKAGEDALSSMKLINYCMHMCEFRREPVYLSESELQKQENISYKEALRRVPELKALRALFIKRVMHTEKWKQNLPAPQ